jgi:hypothetical protein
VALAAPYFLSRRRNTRHEVHIQVRFDDARDFVTQHAENLSSGGLFVVGAHELEPGSRQSVEVELPRWGTFRVEARVAHLVPPGTDRSPGAGLEIIDPPPGFDEAIRAYLLQLGRRKDFVVLSDSDDARALFERAGFVSELVPRPSELLAAIARRREPVLAVVVARDLEEAYRAVSREAGDGDLVVAYERGDNLRDLLPRLDEGV